MAATLGAVSGAVGLFQAALTLIQRIRTARDHVRGTSKTLEDTTNQLEALSSSIIFLKAESHLHTPNVINQIRLVISAGEDLHAFFEKLRKAQEERNAFRQHIHAFVSGDDDDKKLAVILSCLAGAKADLMLCVQAVGVGLIGTLETGFRVMTATLNDVESKVEKFLEFKLTLYEMVANRASDQDGTKEVRGDEIVRLNRTTTGTPEGHRSSSHEPSSAPAVAPDVSNEIYDNVTEDQARAFAGDIGVESWEKKAGTAQRNTIRNNRFGSGSYMVAGNVSGDTGKEFLKTFFK